MTLHAKVEKGQQLETTPLRIPKALWLHARRIEIDMVPRLMYAEDTLGHAAYREDKIRLQRNEQSYPLPQRNIEQVYLHELVHWILHTMGEYDLRSNEKFVDVFASLLHQAFVMAEYDEPAVQEGK